MARLNPIRIGTYSSSGLNPPRLAWGWRNVGMKLKMISSAAGRARPPIRLVGCRQASLTSLRTSWPNAAAGAVPGTVRVVVMPSLLPSG